MSPEETRDLLLFLSRELERILPDPTSEQVERLAHVAGCLAAEAGVLEPATPLTPLELLDDAVDLLGAVVNANHPPKQIEGPLSRHQPLNELFDALWVVRKSALALATGDLAVKIAAKGYLAGALKTLQAHFKHLTWQTQRVADGDFSQRVDFMGEFAAGFNAMAERLAQSVEALKQKEAELTAKNQELEQEIRHRQRVEMALRESEERYRGMAMIDHLTGLYNRRHFYLLAENEIKRSRRHGRELAMIMLDIDRFKQVNDQYGHDIGDKVLVEVGQVASGFIRSMDICARIGGEEFTLLLPETHPSQALKVADRLRETLALACVSTGQGWIGITVSIGVTGLEPGQYGQASSKEVLEMLMKQADEALYASKKAGRNCVTLFEPA